MLQHQKLKQGSAALEIAAGLQATSYLVPSSYGSADMCTPTLQNKADDGVRNTPEHPKFRMPIFRIFKHALELPNKRFQYQQHP